MAEELSREERQHCELELKRIDEDLSKMHEALRAFDGPLGFTPKQPMKGLLEQQYANLERQRDHFLEKLRR